MKTKPKIKLDPASGFTLIELLVVISMWMIIATIVLMNYAGQRVPRDMKIASNELTTNIRKVQGYALSSRNAPSGNPTRFYLLEFNRGTRSYSVYAIDNLSLTAHAVNTALLPVGAQFAGLFVQQPTGTTALRPNCAQVAFGLPYGKIYVDTTCSMRTAQSIVADPALLAVTIDSTITLWLNQTSGGTTTVKAVDKFINVSAISGSILGYDVAPTVPGVCFNQPNQNC